jgi:hypothetical protein
MRGNIRAAWRRTGIRQRQEDEAEDRGRVLVSVEYQCKLLLAAMLWQTEQDTMVYRDMGLIRDGVAVLELPPGRNRMHADGRVDLCDVRHVVAGMTTGYWQRWSNGLELGHKVNVTRLMGNAGAVPRRGSDVGTSPLLGLPGSED